ncbi:hypothetical protein PRIPAC_72290 [Pristionchus pacificus]|uniref:DUF7774 domain-containing protein n=1 Tax=Pristionchus pacificus TaxID=54126 RepID=A0A2A6D0T8_PRIPA|nr:hypothetical protein PRIPAC_72290 [Pristionchus pacificus]|eukprot:PDM83901.1 hypothetical protein PRIPAC_30388 [Pristionchus pacificus]
MSCVFTPFSLSFPPFSFTLHTSMHPMGEGWSLLMVMMMFIPSLLSRELDRICHPIPSLRFSREIASQPIEKGSSSSSEQVCYVVQDAPGLHKWNRHTRSLILTSPYRTQNVSVVYLRRPKTNGIRAVIGADTRLWRVDHAHDPFLQAIRAQFLMPIVLKAMPLYSKYEEHNVLIFGLAGGAGSMYLRFQRPKINITVVEEERDVIELSKRWFGLLEDSRYSIVNRKADAFLQEALDNDYKYDVITIDWFDSTDLSISARTIVSDIPKMASACLTSSGVFVVHINDIHPMDQEFTMSVTVNRKRALSNFTVDSPKRKQEDDEDRLSSLPHDMIHLIFIDLNHSIAQFSDLDITDILIDSNSCTEIIKRRIIDGRIGELNLHTFRMDSDTIIEALYEYAESFPLLLPHSPLVSLFPGGRLSSMTKDDAENPPSKRLRQFRKLFNDYTNNKDVKKPSPSGRRPSASPVTESPVSTPQRRSASRTPRARKRGDDAVKSKGAEPREVSPATPEKDDGTKHVAEAKELAKADDEEFENVADNLAKCKIKQRELQWKTSPSTPEDEKKKAVMEVMVADKNVYKSYDESPDVAIRRKKSRVTPVKKPSSRRKRTAGSTASPVFNPSAEVLDDLPPPVEKGVRCRTKKTETPNSRTRSPSAESCNETDLQEIDQNSKDFKKAIKLMEILKRNNLLENALFPAQNEVLKAFFEGGVRNPDNKILGLISKAMDFVLDAVFFRGEDLDCMLETSLKQFITDRSKSKPILLDVIISRPEFLPQSWGGRTVVLKRRETTVHIEPKK